MRVSGVKVGTIDAIEPEGTQARMTLNVDRDVPGSRRRQGRDRRAEPGRRTLRPARRRPTQTSGPTMADGAVIPVDRTAVPVEWDEVKAQLMRLATDLGPNERRVGHLGRPVHRQRRQRDGRQRREAAADAGRNCPGSAGSSPTAAATSSTSSRTCRRSSPRCGTATQQIVQFQDRLATLTSVRQRQQVRSRRGADRSVGRGRRRAAVRRGQPRTRPPSRCSGLANVTQNLVDHRMDLENLLHVAPNAFANGYNIYNPDTGGRPGRSSLTNFSNPVQFICGAIGAVENTTAPETAKLCAQYLGPGTAAAELQLPAVPDQSVPDANRRARTDIIYTDPKLAPGGAGPADAPETPPAVSAYTGVRRCPPPPRLGLRPARRAAGPVRARRQRLPPVAGAVPRRPDPGTARRANRSGGRRSTDMLLSADPGAAAPPPRHCYQRKGHHRHDRVGIACRHSSSRRAAWC